MLLITDTLINHSCLNHSSICKTCALMRRFKTLLGNPYKIAKILPAEGEQEKSSKFNYKKAGFVLCRHPIVTFIKST